MAKWSADVHRRREREGAEAPVVNYSAIVTLAAPTDENPVTMADLQQLLLDAMTENDIPETARVTEGAQLLVSWTDADLPP